MSYKYHLSIHSTKISRLLVIFIIFSTVFMLQQCKKNSTEPEEFIYPDSNLSFIDHIQPIFQRDCATSGCHTGTPPQNGLDLGTLTPTFMSNNGPVVIAFDADHSRLYRVLLSDYLGISRMPRGRGPLSTGKITAIRTWINEGAIINK
ncbi:MAG: hypothetical protein KAJ16_01110 [Calditrichia bacterium]|nr:hypothetical protein [Calditrichia bacterium]